MVRFSFLRIAFVRSLPFFALTLIPALCLGGDPVSQRREKNSRGTWESMPPMKHARAAHVVVATERAIYALAGTGGKGGAPVLVVERFDGEKWADETTLPGRGLNAPGAVALDQKVYLIGGFNTVTNVPTADVAIYDTVAQAWSKGPPLPAPRGGHTAAVLEGKIHVVGGGNTQSTLADHSVFDPAANAWSARAKLPRALGSPAVVAFGKKLYSIGGRSGADDFADVYIYDPETDKWSKGPAIAPRATSGAISYRGSIFLFGGESQAESAVLPDVLRLSQSATKWVNDTPMPTPRSFARAVEFRDAVYVVGGSPVPQRSHAPKGLSVVERFTLNPAK